MTENFAQLFEESLKTVEMDVGSIITGVVIDIDNEWVTVHAGLKSEGVIPRSQFLDDNGEFHLEIGDEVYVALEAIEDGNGETRLSREKARRAETWKSLESSFENSEVVRGAINGKVKGGFTVDIQGIRAFLPGSLVDVRPVRDTAHLEGQTLDFKVIKLDQKRNNIVVSRRAVLEQANSAEREQLLSNLQEGATLKGVVKNLTDYGAFVDLGGVDGLLHITDMSWGRLNHPSEMFQVGDKVEVAILKYDKDTERVSLGYKQKFPDPWLSVEERYPIQATVKGKVVSITDYGAFVELEPGIEGLVHVSEMSWTKKVKSAKGMVNLGDQVEALILQVDSENRRISLGMKQITPNPWMAIAEKYQPGMIVTGTVRNITEFGAFVELEEGIDGLIHVSDFSWTKKIKHPGEIVKKGDSVTAKVLNLDPLAQRMSLGVKQMEPNVWEIFFENHNVGAVITGKIARLTDFGAFVDLGDGIEGLVHVSELSRKRVEDIQKEFTAGQELTMKIVKLDPTERRIGLSVKQLEQDTERGDFEAAKARQPEFKKATLADAFNRAERE